jgi:uncharacterized SAM-binding protein YcdF (DUF218 family)
MMRRFFKTSKSNKILFAIGLFCVVGVFVITSIYRLLDNYLVVTKPLERAGAIVLMAGSKTQRLPVVVDLYQRGFADTVLLTNDGVLSAWSPEHSRNLYQVEWTQLELIKNGVPEEAIVQLNYTHSGTYYDAQNTKSYVQENKIRGLVIVTSDYHTRRTLWTFKKVFDGFPIKLGIYSTSTDCSTESCEGRVQRLHTLVYEYLKLIYYKCRFGLLE